MLRQVMPWSDVHPPPPGGIHYHHCQPPLRAIPCHRGGTPFLSLFSPPFGAGFPSAPLSPLPVIMRVPVTAVTYILVTFVRSIYFVCQVCCGRSIFEPHGRVSQSLLLSLSLLLWTAPPPTKSTKRPILSSDYIQIWT